MEDIVIEKDIPIPKINVSKRRKYPFMLLKVGDSFYIKAEGDVFKKIEATLRSSALYYQGVSPHRFSVKRVDGGIRCWRTE